MSKFFIATLILFFFSFLCFAQENEFRENELIEEELPKDELTEVSLGGTTLLGGVDCFEYYRFGSIEIELQPQKLNFKAGEAIRIQGIVENTNNYPIVQGNLLFQILRETPYSLEYGHDLIDEFFFPEEISLPPNSQKEITLEWKIPEGLSEGRYVLASHFIVAKKMNVSGLSFVENLYGGVTYFNVEANGKGSQVLFQKNTVLINGNPYYFRGFFPQFSKGEEIKIDFSLNNFSDILQEVQLSKKLFRWDNLLEEQKLEEKQETFKIAPKQTKKLRASFSSLNPGVYLFEAIAKTPQSQSILKVRFSIRGENPPGRINFTALNNFPLKNGEPTFFFTCFHSTADLESFEGRVVTELRDHTGQILQSKEYKGVITPQMMAFKQEFTPQVDLDKVTLTSLVYDAEDNLLDKVSLNYNCGLFLTPSKILIEVEDKELKVPTVNLCDLPVEARMSIEVSDSKGELVYFEPSFQGRELKKIIDFKEGETYKIRVISSGLEQVYSFTYPKEAEPPKLLGFLLIGNIVLIIVVIIIVIFVFKKVKRKSQSKK